ncbi:hypothetical protein, partial [Nonomuraea antri]|uniref:hypothetical protein n=1 Tax=Nonomuraea antri TaxID=2730852 RepID=UPI001C2B8DD4
VLGVVGSCGVIVLTYVVPQLLVAAYFMPLLMPAYFLLAVAFGALVGRALGVPRACRMPRWPGESNTWWRPHRQARRRLPFFDAKAEPDLKPLEIP